MILGVGDYCFAAFNVDPSGAVPLKFGPKLDEDNKEGFNCPAAIVASIDCIGY